jgi:predicted  nucleic acid-binding Zn-ribbon protein
MYPEAGLMSTGHQHTFHQQGQWVEKNAGVHPASQNSSTSRMMHARGGEQYERFGHLGMHTPFPMQSMQPYSYSQRHNNWDPHANVHTEVDAQFFDELRKMYHATRHGELEKHCVNAAPPSCMSARCGAHGPYAAKCSTKRHDENAHWLENKRICTGLAAQDQNPRVRHRRSTHKSSHQPPTAQGHDIAPSPTERSARAITSSQAGNKINSTDHQPPRSQAASTIRSTNSSGNNSSASAAMPASSTPSTSHAQPPTPTATVDSVQSGTTAPAAIGVANMSASQQSKSMGNEMPPAQKAATAPNPVHCLASLPGCPSSATKSATIQPDNARGNNAQTPATGSATPKLKADPSEKHGQTARTAKALAPENVVQVLSSNGPARPVTLQNSTTQVPTACAPKHNSTAMPVMHVLVPQNKSAHTTTIVPQASATGGATAATTEPAVAARGYNEPTPAAQQAPTLTNMAFVPQSVIASPSSTRHGAADNHVQSQTSLGKALEPSISTQPATHCSNNSPYFAPKSANSTAKHASQPSNPALQSTQAPENVNHAGKPESQPSNSPPDTTQPPPNSSSTPQPAARIGTLQNTAASAPAARTRRTASTRTNSPQQGTKQELRSAPTPPNNTHTQQQQQESNCKHLAAAVPPGTDSAKASSCMHTPPPPPCSAAVSADAPTVDRQVRMQHACVAYLEDQLISLGTEYKNARDKYTALEEEYAKVRRRMGEETETLKKQVATLRRDCDAVASLENELALLRTAKSGPEQHELMSRCKDMEDMRRQMDRELADALKETEEMKKKKDNEVSALRTALEHRDKALADVQRAKNDVEKQMDAEVASLRAALEDMKRQQESSVPTLDKARILEDTVRQQDEVIAAFRLEHGELKKKLQDADASLERAVQDIKEERNEEVATLTADIAGVVKQRDRMLQELHCVAADLRENTDQELAALPQDTASALEALRKAIAGLLERNEANVTALRANCSNLRDENKRCKSELKSARKKCRVAEEQCAAAESSTRTAQREREQLLMEKKALREENKALQDKINVQVAELQSESKELDALKQKRKELRGQLHKAQDEMCKLKNEKRDSEEHLGEVLNELDTCRELAQEKDARIAALDEELKAACAKTQAVMHENDALKKEKHVIKKRHEDVQRELEGKIGALQQVQQELAGKNSDLEHDIGAKHKELEALRARHEEVCEDFEAFRTCLAMFNDKVSRKTWVCVSVCVDMQA